MDWLRRRKVKKYGWVRDLPNHQDIRFKASVKPNSLPSKVSHRELCPTPYDQGNLGSCTANAIGHSLAYNHNKRGMKPFTASRLYIYYGERVIEGTVPYDAGAQIRDGVKIVAVKGVCEEILWPYIESKFDERPSQAALDRGAKKAGTRYERVLQTLPEIKAAIASGFCPIFGFSVFESFESDDVAKTGVVPIPDPEEELIGGHAVMMCGYDDSIECFEVENSWGPNWGDHGFFWLPYEFADRHMSSDYWILKTII